MEALYGQGYQLLKQLGYNGKGCGLKEQVIRVPIEPDIQETKSGLGYYPSKITKASKNPSLDINTIMQYSPKKTLTLMSTNLIDTTSDDTTMNYFQNDEALVDIFPVYDNLPIDHHKRRVTCTLSNKGYFGEESKTINIEHDDNECKFLKFQTNVPYLWEI